MPSRYGNMIAGSKKELSSPIADRSTRVLKQEATVFPEIYHGK
jgi:hypothetical protein